MKIERRLSKTERRGESAVSDKNGGRGLRFPRRQLSVRAYDTY
jgi:hypothetical protein